jgi:hypothetical protein
MAGDEQTSSDGGAVNGDANQLDAQSGNQEGALPLADFGGSGEGFDLGGGDLFGGGSPGDDSPG